MGDSGFMGVMIYGVFVGIEVLGGGTTRPAALSSLGRIKNERHNYCEAAKKRI